MREKSDQELNELLQQERHKLFKMRNERSLTKKSETPHQYKECKKTIARLLTIQGEKLRNSI